MSRRTAEANKAIRLAWEREQELVREGKGTRNWTTEQQKDILKTEKGKAYDENGRAFEGQHMKSVEAYPECQGDPGNIQFLTKEEHRAAHKGNWQNPTNWHYNPATGQFTDFGEGTYTPCAVIELSEPVVNEASVVKDKDIVRQSDYLGNVQTSTESIDGVEYLGNTTEVSSSTSQDSYLGTAHSKESSNSTSVSSENGVENSSSMDD